MQKRLLNCVCMCACVCFQLCFYKARGFKVWVKGKKMFEVNN